MFVEVALDLPLDQTFTYKLSGFETYPPQIGKRVIVPFGRSNLLKTGIIVSITSEPPSLSKVKEVFEIPDPFPLLGEEELSLCRWISDYYCSSFGEAIFRFLPEAFLVEEEIRVYLKEFKGVKLTPSEEEVVKELLSSSTGSLKVSTLKKRLNKSSIYRLLLSLSKKGVIEKRSSFKRDSLPKEKYLRLLKDCSYKGKRGRELIELIRKKGELPYVEAVNSFGFSRQVIDRLIEKGCLELVLKEVSLQNKEQELKDLRQVFLTPSQKKVLKELDEGNFHLLTGTTGSGKMELYLNFARKVVKEGGGVIILVPELLLTPELRARVEAYFGTNVGIYHGKLTQREKASTWLKALKGEVKVFLGTRQAVLLPVKGLKLIIVDEEQDPSYKEQQKPYYHAREVALKRAELQNLKLILVSATPSVDSYYLFKEGKVKGHFLKERVGKVPPPKVSVLNLSQEERIGIFSKKLLNSVERVVNSGDQALLYIPKKGFYSALYCLSCGFVAQCKYCNVNLTYYKSKGVLICHLCGRRYRAVFRCPRCKGKLSFKGYGTERVEEEIKLIFPDFKTVRLDPDTVKDPLKGARLIKEIKEGKYQVIVGSNIAIKGHNFPKLTFVGVLLAEMLSGAPDFKSSERIFQGIVQATGRAGRFSPGFALVQTFNPELLSVKCAVNYELEEFYSQELFFRETLGYPPYTLGVLLEFQLKNRKIERQLKELYEKLRLKLDRYFSFPKLNPAPIAKISGKYRYLAFLTSYKESESEIDKLVKLKTVIWELFSSSKIVCKIDVNPTKII
ncbi:replication restart helicase PriA [Thermovibrio sp.]